VVTPPESPCIISGAGITAETWSINIKIERIKCQYDENQSSEDRKGPTPKNVVYTLNTR
jgi:hypothetical protein